MNTILISPYAKKLRNGGNNPKNYPYWEDLIIGLKKLNFQIVQVGADDESLINGVDDFKKNLPFDELEKLVESCTTWISVDNFFHHFCTYHNKKGIVLFSQSDPNIFGHVKNINLLKDRSYLRIDQFNIWESAKYNINAYMTPDKIIKCLLNSDLIN